MASLGSRVTCKRTASASGLRTWMVVSGRLGSQPRDSSCSVPLGSLSLPFSDTVVRICHIPEVTVRSQKLVHVTRRH